jgi:hypothetical protein
MESKTEIWFANRIFMSTESELPHLKNERNDKELPKLAKFKTLMELANRACEKIDMLDPNLAKDLRLRELAR